MNYFISMSFFNNWPIAGQKFWKLNFFSDESPIFLLKEVER